MKYLAHINENGEEELITHLRKTARLAGGIFHTFLKWNISI